MKKSFKSNKELSFTNSFMESIVSNKEMFFDITADATEIAIDSFMNDGIIKELPIIKYLVSTFKIVEDIKGRFFLNKMQQFVTKFNDGLASTEEVQKRREKFNGKQRDRELAYITIIIDRYIDFEKPAILAKLYLAYLDNILTWDEFCTYAEVIDKIFRKDLDCLIKYKTYTPVTSDIPAEFLRLTGVGLMFNYQHTSLFTPDERGGSSLTIDSININKTSSETKIFSRTAFGDKLVNIISQ